MTEEARTHALPPLSRLARGSAFVLMAAAAMCVAVLFYVFYHYSLTGQREFGSALQMLAFYGVPGLGAVTLLAGSRLRPERRVALTLLLISTSATVYLGEAALMAYDSLERDTGQTFWPLAWTDATRRHIERVAADYGVAFDTRPRVEVVAALREGGVSAVPGVSLSPFLHEDDEGTISSSLTVDGSEVVPLGGVSNEVTVLCNETGDYLVYESDERGFHNPPGMWAASDIDVAIIGDSYAHGYCVPSDRNFAALIREHHPRTVNLGIAGTGPLAQLAVLRERVTSLRPSVVVWFYFEGNDLVDLARESRADVLRRYLDSSFRQEALDDQEALDAALRSYFDRAMARELDSREAPEPGPGWMARLRSVLTLSHLRGRAGLVTPGEPTPDVVEPDWRLLREVLVEAKATVNSWGGSLHFVYLPDRSRYVEDVDFHRDRVLAVVRESGLPIIDIDQAFRAQGDPLDLFPFRRFGHYNEAGHRVVAESVLDGLSTRADSHRTARSVPTALARATRRAAPRGG
jgi:hypothetical protein